MKKKIKFFIFFLIFAYAHNLFADKIYQSIEPEPYSPKSNLNKTLKAKKFIIITANDYATSIGYQVLKEGGNAVDSAIAVQLLLGLVEPQSSGIGGGTFITYFDAKTKKIFSYEGREKSPKKISTEVFLDKSGKPKKFFEAAVGGASVGVPANFPVVPKNTPAGKDPEIIV